MGSPSSALHGTSVAFVSAQKWGQLRKRNKEVPMERSRGIQNGLKKVVTAMALAAALASTGCGQNALMNPTVDQVEASVENGSANQAGHSLNPAGHSLNP